MAKIFYFFFLFLLLLSHKVYAQEQGKKIEVTAKHLESNATTVWANGEVLVYYQDAIIKADNASYDKTAHLLTLDGNIEMMGYEGSKKKSRHILIDTQSDDITFEELFWVNKDDLWIVAESANKKDDNYTIAKSMVSSCDMNDPIWKMYFERSHYNSQTEDMKLYDAKLYFLDTPILYLPYLSFNIDQKRKSGLLFPLLGYTNNEGFIYEQPIYWAISPSMDMEFNPQVYTNRSVGIYSTFRFVDSLYSKGQIRAGYFADSDAYWQRENNRYQNHYGFEFNYDASRLFSKNFSDEVKDGLYINTTFLNDIDYLNLQKTRMTEFGLTPLQESKVNYFIHNDDYYMGMNAKYFIDTRKEENDDTIQVLPSLNLHKYLEEFVWRNLTYSVDLHFDNFDREDALTLKQAQMKIPVEWTGSFFDDFVNFSLEEEIYYSKFFFGDGSYTYDQFEYYSTIHKVKLFSDLTKQYDTFVHVLQPSLRYIIPGNETHSPVNFKWLTDEQKEFFSVGLPEEHFEMAVGQYFYNTNMNLVFFQRISQIYNKYSVYSYRFSDLKNEMQYNWQEWRFYHDIVYSYEFHEVRASSGRISVLKDDYDLTLSHTYKQKLPDDVTLFVPANDVSLYFGYALDRKISLYGGFAYNIDDATNKQWNIGGKYERDCWSMDLSFRKDIRPRPTGASEETGLYVQVNFKPFASIGSGGSSRVEPY